jgi:hypothetical protein
VSGAPDGVREQVILPWPVAVRITLRGLRIRFARSLITTSGVVLGIAFLMSVLTGDALTAGLAEETRTKAEVNRLVRRVEDEIGSIPGRRIGIWLSAPPADRHLVRLLERLAAQADQGAMPVLRTRPDGSEGLRPGLGVPPFDQPAFAVVSDLPALLRDSHIVILLSEALPALPEADLVAALRGMRQPVVLDVCPGRYQEAALRALDDRIVYASLSYLPTAEENARLARRQQDRAARQLWITAVSILVTVIGISNAMLMSVTERIREIGTMKCLGALDSFIVKLFLLESTFQGSAGTTIGIIVGFMLTLALALIDYGGYVFTYFPTVGILRSAVTALVVGTLLSLVGAMLPAYRAAKMEPVEAMRSDT